MDVEEFLVRVCLLFFKHGRDSSEFRAHSTSYSKEVLDRVIKEAERRATKAERS